MLKNYLKIAFRNLKKNKVYTFINMGGLAMGMAIFLLITMYARHELSYNKFHEKSDHIYQVSIGSDFYTTAPLAPLIKEKIPDFEKIIRVDNGFGGGRSPLFVITDHEGSQKVKFENVLFTDHDFFSLFSFKVIHGDPDTALKEPYSIVLTRSSSQRLFGTENSIGRTIHYIGDRNSQPEMDMTIKAIVEDVPSNSTITFNALASFSTLYAVKPNIVDDWRNWFYSMYVLLRDQNVNEFQSKLKQIWFEREKQLWPGEEHSKISIVPLTDLPFHNNNRRQLIYFIQLIGIFILIIAIINFINLTIAKSTSRAKEIGIRKVVGSNRFELIKQFLCESILISILVAPVAIIIVALSKHPFYEIIQKQIPFDLFQQPSWIGMIIAGVLIVGLIAGIYPAIILSSFKPAAIIKGAITKGKKRNALRFSLFVFQFVISAFLVICTMLISSQIDHLKNKSLGFDQKNIVHFCQNQQINQQYDVFKQKLIQNPNIISVARSNTALGQDLPIGTSHEINGVRKPYSATTVDPDFIPTMGIEMVEGRPFSWDISSDRNSSIIVNETFVKEFKLEPALGAEIDFLDWKTKVIGVMKDFHYNSFHQKVQPSALVYADWNGRISIRISGGNVSDTIRYIEKTWNGISRVMPFEYEFLDDTYNKLYKSDEELHKISTYFSGVAIIIACLGLFGLISYSTEQRTKEIGVRKVLGASVSGLIGLLSQEYIKWVLIANLISWPIVYFVIEKWLQDFPYRISITAWPFLLSGLAALLIALLTVSWQAIKAATANPVDSLKYE